MATTQIPPLPSPTPTLTPSTSSNENLGGKTINKEERDLESSLPPVPSPAPQGPSRPTLALDDPENPKAWANGKRWGYDWILCIWVLSLTYSSTAYVSSLTALEKRFGMSQELTIAGVTLFVLGFAGGPLIFGPISDMFGRRPVYILAGVGYTAFSWGVAFAPNAPALLIFRFFIGFFGSAPLNNVPASLADLTTPAERGPFVIPYPLMAFGGPSLGPLCGAFIESRAGMAWNFRVSAIFVTVFSILAALVPETNNEIILQRKLKREGRLHELQLSEQSKGRQFAHALKMPFVYLVTEPTVVLVALYLAVLYGLLYGFFEAFGVVYLVERHFTPTSYGLTYISLGLGFFFGCGLLATVGVKSYNRQAGAAIAKGLPVPPESRLGLGYVGSALVPIALFIFAWTAPFRHVHWIAPAIGEFLFAIGMMLLFTAFIPYLMENYKQRAATALAAANAARCLVGSVFPLFAVQMFTKLTVQGATSLLAGISLCLAPIPFFFMIYGDRLRQKSKFAQV
ncbi:MFS general substrate transporter [Meredithblackwellia eburnea MCA 4105]